MSTFLTVTPYALGIILACVMVFFLFDFWFKVSGGKRWGLIAWFVSIGIWIGVVAQIAEWLGVPL